VHGRSRCAIGSIKAIAFTYVDWPLLVRRFSLCDARYCRSLRVLISQRLRPCELVRRVIKMYTIYDVHLSVSVLCGDVSSRLLTVSSDGSGNRQLLGRVTGHLADTPTRGLPTRGLDNSRSRRCRQTGKLSTQSRRSHP